MNNRKQPIKKNQKKENAYMTLEATLIYPMIFGGILFTISLAFYLYNAAVIKQISSVAALRGSLEHQINQKDIENMVNKEVEKLVKERLFWVSNIQKEVDVTNAKVQVRLKAKVNLPFIEIPFLNFKWRELEFETQANRVRPVNIIRDVRRINGS